MLPSYPRSLDETCDRDIKKDEQNSRQLRKAQVLRHTTDIGIREQLWTDWLQWTDGVLIVGINSYSWIVIDDRGR